MLNSTIYDIRLRYLVENKASSGVRGLTQDVRRLGDESGKVTSWMTKLGAAATAAFGVAGAKKHLIDFNSEVQNAKIGLSSMIEGNLGGTWDAATARANALYNEFQKFSTLTPVTTQEILEFGKAVAVATFQAGGSIKDLTSITEQGVIAAKAFGYSSSYASLELSEMLAGNVNKRMMFAKQLLGIAKVDEKEFNEMSGSDRLGVVQKVLNSDAMKNAAKAFGDSWSGVTSTLEDKLQILAGKVGLPLFKALTKEVQSWSAWIDANTDKIDEFASKLANGLVTGFGVVKDVMSFIVDHAELLITLGKVWAAVKIGGMLGGGIAGGAGGTAGKIGGLLAWGRGASDRFDEEGKYQYSPAGAGRQNVTMKNIGGALPMLGQTFGAGYAIGSIINEHTGASGHIADAMAHLTGRVDEATDRFDRLTKSSEMLEHAQEKARGQGGGGFLGTTFGANLRGSIEKKKGDVNAAEDFLRAMNSHNYDVAKEKQAELERRGVTVEEAFKERGALQSNQNTLNSVLSAALDHYGSGISKLTDVQVKALDVATAQQQIMEYMARTNDWRHYASGLSPQVAAAQGMIDQAVVDGILRSNVPDKVASKPNVNITIQRIEVQSDDPDRYAFGLVEAFRDAVKNPSAAVRAIREG